MSYHEPILHRHPKAPPLHGEPRTAAFYDAPQTGSTRLFHQPESACSESHCCNSLIENQMRSSHLTSCPANRCSPAGREFMHDDVHRQDPPFNPGSSKLRPQRRPHRAVNVVVLQQINPLILFMRSFEFDRVRGFLAELRSLRRKSPD